MRFLLCLSAFILASCAGSRPAPQVVDILRPALYAASLGESLDGVARRVDPTDRSTLGFAREVMEPRVLAAFARETTAPEAQAFAMWTRRPDVAPFLAMERATADPNYTEVKAAYFETHRPVSDRLEAIDRYLEATGYPFYARDFTLRMLAQRELLASGAVGAVTPDRFEGLVDQIRAADGDVLTDVSANRLMETYYVAFASASVEDIERFTDAVCAPEAQWYFQRLSSAMMEAFDAAVLQSLRTET